MRPTRSSSDSPRPRIPPEHTLIPASRTLSIVVSLSSYDRVVMTYIILISRKIEPLGKLTTHFRIELSGCVEIMIIGSETAAKPISSYNSEELHIRLFQLASLICTQ